MLNIERRHFSASTRVLILLGLALGGLIVASVAAALFLLASDKLLHAVILLQDFAVFILPAVLAVAICYRKPMRFMCLTEAPNWRAVVGVIIVMAVSLPAMNWLVAWNEGLTLPSAFEWMENLLRTSEDAAGEVTKEMMSGTSVWKMLLNLCVVGVMAGVSEEIFFRGGMARLMSPEWRHGHAVIWIVAAVFSAVHMQFYGFVPRLLLGAWMGYLLWWTRSLWVPIIAHALNNSVVVVGTYLDNCGLIPSDAVDHLGVPQNGSFAWLALCSAVVTAVAIVVLRKTFFKKKMPPIPVE